MLIRPIEEIKKYVRVNMNFQGIDLEPFIIRATEKIIIPFIGRDQYDLIDAAFNIGGLTTSQEKLLDKISGALYNWSIMLALPGLNVKVSSAGVHQLHTDQTKPAFQHAILALQNDLANAAFEWVEMMMEFMEANEIDYPLWVLSDQYVKNKDGFINTAAEFNELYNIQCRRLVFHALAPAIYDVECFAIVPTIGQDYFDSLKAEIVAKTISPTNETPLKFIRLAVANLSIAKAMRANWVLINDGSIIHSEFAANSDNMNVQRTATADGVRLKMQDAEETGNRYISKLAEFMVENSADYPLFADWRAAELAEQPDCCETTDAPYNPRKTDPKSKSAVYVF